MNIWIDSPTRCTTVDVVTVCLNKHYSEIDSSDLKKRIRHDRLNELLRTLKITFGKYWNPQCETRLKYIQRKSSNTDYRIPYESTDDTDRFLELTDQLEFVFLYTKYQMLRDNLSLENKQVRSVFYLFQAIAQTQPIEGTLNTYVTDGIQAYFGKFSREYTPSMSATDTDGDDLWSSLAKDYKKTAGKKEEPAGKQRYSKIHRCGNRSGNSHKESLQPS